MCYRVPPAGDAIREISIERLVETLGDPLAFLEVIPAGELQVEPDVSQGTADGREVAFWRERDAILTP